MLSLQQMHNKESAAGQRHRLGAVSCGFLPFLFLLPFLLVFVMPHHGRGEFPKRGEGRIEGGERRIHKSAAPTPAHKGHGSNSVCQ